jgi:hypothetical protein
MLTVARSPATVDDLARLWEHDHAKPNRAYVTRPDPEYSALLERIRLLEQENSILQRQVQLLSDLAVMD